MAENLLGSTKDTVIQDQVEMNFKGETNETGLYLAMARQAEGYGYPEVAAALSKIAWEEALHAARFAELNGKISPSLKENLERMLSGEIGACSGKYDAAKKCKEIAIDCAHDFFHESSRDENRHAGILRGLLQRYFIKQENKK
ncbi:MAG: ferritin family protein [bacterium]